MEFHKVTPADRIWIQEAMYPTGYQSCELSFANIFSWGELWNTEVAQVDGTLICRMEGGYSIPIGQNRDSAMHKLLNFVEKRPFRLFGITEADMDWVRSKVGEVEFEYDRRWSDYLYLSDSLATLKGKKLSAKRNHINAFLREHEDWHTEPITSENIGAVHEFLHRWVSEQQPADENLQSELEMCEKELAQYFELGLEGLILYADGQIVAYSYGEPISNSVYCVHVEKALGQVRGAYPLINREFVKTYCGNYLYVNREDDSGEEGLRKAKLSYDPAIIVHKYEAEVK